MQKNELNNEISNEILDYLLTENAPRILGLIIEHIKKNLQVAFLEKMKNSFMLLVSHF